MNKDAKNIRCTVRPEIERVKGYIRDASRPFDGSGYIFRTALRELRREGMIIRYDRNLSHYTKIERNKP